MSAHHRRRRTQIQDDEDDELSQQRAPSPGSVDGDDDEQMGGVGQRDEISQLVKNLVRYALACEYSRTPIRREGIRDKGNDLPTGTDRLVREAIADHSCSAWLPRAIV